LRVELTPEYTERLQIDEQALERVLENRIGYGDDRARARIRDVNSLSGIHRLRRGRPYFHIEECKAMFVTTNSSLVRAPIYFTQVL